MPHRKLTFLTIALLVFLGFTALVGSIPMMAHPEGNSTTLPLSTLAYSPFHSYLIPGILLFTSNGVLAFFILWLLATRAAYYGLWTAFQGCVLLGWLVAECWLLRMVIWLHYFYGAIALALLVCGLIMWRKGIRADKRPETRSA